MDKSIIFDEELCKRLPLPLAQLYRRAHTAKSEMEQHHVAYYLWEASLKLLASVVVLEHVAQGRQHDEQASLLRKLVRPQTSDWCQILRQLLPLTAQSDASLHRTHELLSCKIQDELPCCADLDSALREDQPKNKESDTLLDLFERLAEYRGSVFGSELFADRPSSFYQRMGQALLQATGEWLPRVDILAEQQLVFVSDVTDQGTGRWLVQRYSLTGDIARRIRPMEITASVHNLPRSGNVYLDGAAACSVHERHGLSGIPAIVASVDFVRCRTRSGILSQQSSRW